MASLGIPVDQGKGFIIHGLCYEHTLNTNGKSWYPSRPGLSGLSFMDYVMNIP